MDIFMERVIMHQLPSRGFTGNIGWRRISYTTKDKVSNCLKWTCFLDISANFQHERYWGMTVTFHSLRVAERPQMKPPFCRSSLHLLITSQQQTLPGTEVKTLLNRMV